MRRACPRLCWSQRIKKKRSDRDQYGGDCKYLRTKSGETLPRHFHNGEEAFYALDDTTIELPGGKQISVKAGNAGISVRDVAHGGVKVVGDKALRLLTVHIVDKGKPLYDSPK